MTPRVAAPDDVAARPWAYDDFLREGLSLIPAWAPGWTNHNASDPGITLVELFAYLADILAYRALRIAPDAKLNFLRLLEGADGGAEAAWRGRPPNGLDAAIAAHVQAMARPRCAVTPLDFEREALAAAARHLGPDEPVRARAVAGVDLSGHDAERTPQAVAAAAGDMSVVLAPERELAPEALAALCREVQQDLAPRCLLGTHVHVVLPVVLHVAVGARVALEDGVSPQQAVTAINAALRRRFGPALPGEPLAAARPLGRSLFLSEVVEAIDAAEGVDWVEDVILHRVGVHGEDPADTLVGLRIGSVSRVGADTRLGGRISRGSRRLLRDADGEVVSLRLDPWEQVRVRVAQDALTRIDADEPAGERR